MNLILSFKLGLVGILLLIPLGISYLLSKLIKTSFLTLLSGVNSILVLFLICLTIVAIGHTLQEKRYDAEEANLDYSKDPTLYIRAIRKKIATYLHTKYGDAEVETLAWYTYPLKDSNTSQQKPDIIEDSADHP